MRIVLNWFLAYTRLDLNKVCEMSEKLGREDYHNVYDTTDKIERPFDMHYCGRCGKQFVI